MLTFASPLRRALATARDAEAVVCEDVRYTYAELAARCHRLAGALDQLGLGRGDRVAVVGPNSHRYVELYLGVPASGRVVVPLNARHTDAELEYAMRDGGVRVLFAEAGRAASPQLAACVERVIDLGDGYEQLVAGSQEADFPHDVGENDLAGLFYTGGTTGASKGVMLTHRNLVANTFHLLAHVPLTPETRWLVIAPLFHAAGSVAVLGTVWAGGTQVVLPAFDPGAALDLIEREGITATLGVPTMLAALAEEQLARPRQVGSLASISHGGSPITTAVLKRTHEAFPTAELVHLYGATETAPLVTVLPGEQHHLDDPLARSCGQPVIGVEVAIFDADGTALPAGAVGEVVTRGLNVMAGYWNKPKETAAALAGGWYHTGDLGYQDDRGHLFLVDRAKDMIVTGGENVYSTEVEEVLYRHPLVLEAAVFGVPDERWGEAVHAVVVPRGPVTADELRAHCRAEIAGYKVPKKIDVRDEPLPKSGAGKVLKRELREPFWAGRELRVGG